MISSPRKFDAQTLAVADSPDESYADRAARMERETPYAKTHNERRHLERTAKLLRRLAAARDEPG